ncbi:MAG: glycine zipper 2TM domain-containing protein [Caulobacterales bacterium]|nr:glycine zipper 2TM domain-containing protein [Caulobacterales bacterium]
MRLHQLAAGVAVAALIPTFALAQQSCEQRQSNRAVGTIAGAGIGALLGGAVAGHDDRAAGAVVGGLGGALVGNQLAKSNADCAHAYGFYDRSGAWHASTVTPQHASGYFDRDGAWVDGAPNGHYDRDGRWVRTQAEAATAGYTDRNGHWVPASAAGYYTADGRWVAGAASGHYDRGGRWVAGPATGHYDSDGRWISGRPSQVADVQPGYYDGGHWRRGAVSGYYDTQGRWVAVDASGDINSRHEGGPPSDISARSTWLDSRIRHDVSDGALTRREGDQALRRLDSIDRQVTSLRRSDGDLRPRDQRMIMAKLDDLTTDVRAMSRGPVRED